MHRLIVLFLICFANVTYATNYYISSLTGDDNRTVYQAQNPSTPWRSIDKLNSINFSLKPGDSILFKRGESFFGSILVKSSGTFTSPIYYGAYGTGSNPIISSFSTLTNWIQSSNGIYYTTLEVPSLNIVTINGEAKGMGRFPNTGYLKYEGNNGNVSITDNELPASPSWTGGEIVLRKYRFILDRHTITSHIGTTLNYSNSNNNGNNAAFSPVKNNGYFIQNHLNTLDQFGEWYYDALAKRLYMHFGGGTPAGLSIKASTKDYNVFVATANNINFVNLTFEGGNTKGLFMTSSSNAFVKDCHFYNQGGSSILAIDVNGITVKGGSVNTSFSNGIFFEHNANNCTVDGVYVNNTNMIPGTQRSGTGISVGITINGDGAKIINNRVIKSGYNGISFLGDNVLVERNYIDTFCTLKDDGGGIYTYMGASNITSVNRKIKDNIIINAIGAQEATGAYSYEAYGKAAGIYLDEHVNNVEVTGNSVANGDWAGIFLHNAHHNTISGNIFYNHRYQVHVSQYTAITRSNVMTNNQYISKKASQETFYYRTFVPDNPSTMGNFDKNYYSRPLDDTNSIHCDFYQSGGAGTIYMGLDQWKSLYALDPNSQKSPLTFRSNIDDSIRFEYNATNNTKVITLDANYIDVLNNPYSGSLNLPPFTSVVLLRNRNASVKMDQNITFSAIAGKTYGDLPFALTAVASSNLSVAYRVVSGPATIQGNILTLTGAGTITVEASQLGNYTFNAAIPVTQIVKVAKANQTITFSSITNKTFGEASFSLNATSSSGLPVNYKLLSGPATIVNNNVTLTGSGTVIIEASQPGDNNFGMANPVTQSFIVTPPVVALQQQSILFPVISNRTFNNESFALSASASSGLPVSYRVISGPASINGTNVFVNGIGSVTIEATQVGNSSYQAATPVLQNFTITKGTQVITFGSLTDKINTDLPFVLTATATSGLAVSYKVISGPATLSGNTLSLTGGTGTVWIESSQSGNTNYLPANAVLQSFNVKSLTSATKLSQTITFNTLSYKTYTSPDFVLTAMASSGLPVVFKVISGPVILSGNSVSIKGVGSVTIEALQPGNDNYNSAVPVRRSFTIGKAGQTITFPVPSGISYGVAPFALSATASSNLPVNYRLISGPAKISGNIISITGVGTVTIEVSQPGDANFSAAWTMQRSFSVSAASNVLTSAASSTFQVEGDETKLVPLSKSSISIYPNPVSLNATITISVEQPLNGVLDIIDLQGNVIQNFGKKTFDISQNNILKLDATNFISGIYIIRFISQNGVISQQFQLIK